VKKFGVSDLRPIFLLRVLVLPLFFTVISASPGLSASARDNYAFYCAQCHGLKGRGDGPNATESQPVDPRDHTSAYDMKKLTDSDIIDVLHDGGSATSKSTLMPPFKKTLSDKEIEDLKDYLRTLCRC